MQNEHTIPVSAPMFLFFFFLLFFFQTKLRTPHQSR